MSAFHFVATAFLAMARPLRADAAPSAPILLGNNTVIDSGGGAVMAEPHAPFGLIMTVINICTQKPEI